MFNFCDCDSPLDEPQDNYSWQSGLCDCHTDMSNAIMTALFPCVTFGRIAEVLDEGESPRCVVFCSLYLVMMPLLCSQWMISSCYRRKLRRRYQLLNKPCGDTITHMFCPCCTLCQEYRELKHKGLDPALGWKGIVTQKARQNGNRQTTAPPPDQSMTR
ncbi:hypothetical protein BT93_F2441 [Corymbia citriodora subsp. variegata]|nr:hypothetical protein BT93_F2441 [Corymbia citriodora subsp. variegata]